MSTVRVKYSTQGFEEIAADININGVHPYYTQLTAYNNPITLSNVQLGCCKKIKNSSNATVVINCDNDLENAPTDTLTLTNKAWVVLLYGLDDESGSPHWSIIDLRDTGVSVS